MNTQSRYYYKRTKIIATLGPSITQHIFTWDEFNNPENKDKVAKAYAMMESIINSGVTCVRLNLSHGTHEEHSIRIRIAREVAKKLNRNIAIMLDTKGPEIRIEKLSQDSILIESGQKLTIHTTKTVLGDKTQFSVTDSSKTYNMAKDVKNGSFILVDDGKLQLIAEEVDVDNGIIKAKALNTHVIKEKKRINLPGSEYTIPFLSEKDISDINFACEQNCDYIAASFTNSADNVNSIRKLLAANNKLNIQIIAKIETGHGIKSLDEIIKAADGIMIARGDLGLEIPYYDVPYWEKQMIRKGRFTGKPCIVATQMLDSLERSLQPTRAEVTDVFFAVERGADATMLSGESAQGLHPVEAVKTMANIDVKGEILFDYDHAIKDYFPYTSFPRYAERTAIKIASKVRPTGTKTDPIFPYDFVTLFTDDKVLIRALSNIRPAVTIIVITSEEEIIRSFAISYGIQSYLVKDLNEAKLHYEEVSKQAMQPLPGTENRVIAFFDKKFHKIAE